MPIAAVRNGVLGRLVTSVDGWHVLFTAPADSAVLLKHVQVHNGSQSEMQIGLLMISADGQVVVSLLSQLLGPSEDVAWAGWTALDPGDQLQVYGAAALLHAWSAGAVLPGAPPELPVQPIVGR